MASPEISVVMSVYEGEAHLGAAIESILGQSYPDFEFIIVDDGSTDRTGTIIRAYRDRRIKVIRNEQNQGLTRSLHKALQSTRGCYIARMDADDISHGARLERQRTALERDPQLACVGCHVQMMDREGRFIKTVKMPGGNMADYLRRRNCFVHGSLMFSRAALMDVGDYRQDMKLAQDYELLLRLSRKYQVGYVPDTLLYRAGQSAEPRHPYPPSLPPAGIAVQLLHHISGRSSQALEFGGMARLPLRSIVGIRTLDDPQAVA
jgi:glycosyltransferase involved in cell wall biosynthesis